jgi:hypothetical protein
MQIARVLAALRGTELADPDAVATPCVRNRMKGLVDICDEVNDELKRLNPVGVTHGWVHQYPLEHFNPVNHTVVAIGLRSRVIIIGPVTVSLLVECRARRNVYEVPIVGFVSLRSDLICPAGNRSQALILQQRFDAQFRALGQMRLCQRRDNRVAVTAPAEQSRRDQPQ